MTIKIKKTTALKFRSYARGLGKRQSETLQLMLDFFEGNQLSPLDNLGPNMLTLEKKLKIRINAVVAILRDIEKTQTKPTLAMLQLLFQETPAKKEVFVEKTVLTQKTEERVQEQRTEKMRLLERKLHCSRQLIETLLENVTASRSSFGKVQLRLMISEAEFLEIKRELQKI